MLPKNPYTDEELFQLISCGDEKAFDVLFMRYYPMLCAYARQYVEPEDSEEIVQDCMVWFWQNREMQLYTISFKSYLFRMVKNKCLTLINRNEIRRRITGIFHERLREQFDDPDFYIVEELTNKIESALASLPDTYRESFEMNRFQQMTYHEIADKLQISPKTVDYRIQQALKKLRAELKDYLPLLTGAIL